MSGPNSSSSYIQVPDAATSQQSGGGAANNAGKVKVVAGYALQQKLGSGSFAVVYKGVRLPDKSSSSSTDVNSHDDGNNDTVAIKAITRTSDKLTAKVLQNLEIEISILHTYRQRNIVCLHDVQKTERHFYLILEYCGGGDVQRLIRTRRAGRLTEGLTRRLMRDLSSGLRFLWGQELIHRDIKPQNLLLTGPLPVEEMHDPERTDETERKRVEADFPSRRFCLKIADFGFARHLESASLAETLCGSPLYMAPEILQHHRYDAKADLWSVGTVLFEMISGRPPFNGENHIDLLRNIQRKAVRLPPDVRVSKECVNLLRLLLNRNPLSRAGFKEFFEACDAFVALGCQGDFVPDDGTCQKPTTEQQQQQLRTIPENQTTAPSSSPPTLQQSPQQHQQEHQHQLQLLHQYQPQNSAADPSSPDAAAAISRGQLTATAPTAVRVSQTSRPLEPLVPSPPMSGVSPIHQMVTNTTSRYPSPLHAVEIVHTGSKEQQQPSSLNASTEDNSFVMVEHGSYQRSPAASTTADPSRQRTSSPSSPGYFLKNPMMRTPPGDYVVMKPPKGMLSTSPGTGGALMGFIQGSRRRLTGNEGPSAATDNSTTAKQRMESQIVALTKLMAASEDVGRRAISVAHLGDNRAYLAMHLAMLYEGGSSQLSACPMEGIEEEEAGNVTDDEASTEIAATRRRRSSSVTDRSMPDVKEEEAEEMPFAMPAEAPPVIAAGMPSRSSNSFTKGYSNSITSSKPTIKPTPAMIRAHFNEALRCYLKTLQMLKGALGATQRVRNEAEALMSQRAAQPYQSGLEELQKRWETTSKWLNEQFKGVLDRADAANNEIAKVPQPQNTDDKAEKDDGMIVEELIYNHALSCGRDGAVKQLLGQFEAARACYRSAGLLAETLLMEQNLGADDRKVLEDYVDGFAARITELDEYMTQSVMKQRNAAAATTSATGVSRRSSPAVVSLVAAQAVPMKSSGTNLGPRPFY